MRIPRAAAALALGLAACSGNTLLPEPARDQLEQQLAGHVRYLRVACFVTPFFHDGGKLLLTDQSPDEVDLVEKPNGEPVDPGAPIKVLPPGTPLRIQEISFPTAFVMAERTVAFTPREDPWVLLRRPDDFHRDDKPYVLVLPPDVKTAEGFRERLGEYLSPDDPTADFHALSAEIRAAVTQKTVLPGMTPHEVEMAWGYPEQIHIDGPTRSETWTWPFQKQRAWFAGGTLAKWDDHGHPGP